MPLSTHKNVVFSQWESLTDTKLFCSSCSTSSTLMLSNLGDRQHPWKMMNYFPLTFSHFKGHPCPWKMIYLKPCHCFARSVLLCVVLCSAVLFCDLMCLYAEHKTKNLTGMVGNAYLPSCHFWKLWLCQWPSALHHLMLWTDPNAQRCHPFWDICKWGFRRTAYANFITIKSNKTLRFYPKIAVSYTHLTLPTKVNV